MSINFQFAENLNSVVQQQFNAYLNNKYPEISSINTEVFDHLVSIINSSENTYFQIPTFNLAHQIPNLSIVSKIANESPSTIDLHYAKSLGKISDEILKLIQVEKECLKNNSQIFQEDCLLAYELEEMIGQINIKLHYYHDNDNSSIERQACSKILRSGLNETSVIISVLLKIFAQLLERRIKVSFPSDKLTHQFKFENSKNVSKNTDGYMEKLENYKNKLQIAKNNLFVMLPAESPNIELSSAATKVLALHATIKEWQTFYLEHIFHIHQLAAIVYNSRRSLILKYFHNFYENGYIYWKLLAEIKIILYMKFLRKIFSYEIEATLDDISICVADLRFPINGTFVNDVIRESMISVKRLKSTVYLIQQNISINLSVEPITLLNKIKKSRDDCKAIYKINKKNIEKTILLLEMAERVIKEAEIIEKLIENLKLVLQKAGLFLKNKHLLDVGIMKNLSKNLNPDEKEYLKTFFVQINLLHLQILDEFKEVDSIKKILNFLKPLSNLVSGLFYQTNAWIEKCQKAKEYIMCLLINPKNDEIPISAESIFFFNYNIPPGEIEVFNDEFNIEQLPKLPLQENHYQIFQAKSEHYNSQILQNSNFKVPVLNKKADFSDNSTINFDLKDSRATNVLKSKSANLENHLIQSIENSSAQNLSKISRTQTEISILQADLTNPQKRENFMNANPTISKSNNILQKKVSLQDLEQNSYSKQNTEKSISKPIQNDVETSNPGIGRINSIKSNVLNTMKQELDLNLEKNVLVGNEESIDKIHQNPVFQEKNENPFNVIKNFIHTKIDQDKVLFNEALAAKNPVSEEKEFHALQIDTAEKKDLNGFDLNKNGLPDISLDFKNKVDPEKKDDSINIFENPDQFNQNQSKSFENLLHLDNMDDDKITIMFDDKPKQNVLNFNYEDEIILDAEFEQEVQDKSIKTKLVNTELETNAALKRFLDEIDIDIVFKIDSNAEFLKDQLIPTISEAKNYKKTLQVQADMTREIENIKKTIQILYNLKIVKVLLSNSLKFNTKYHEKIAEQILNHFLDSAKSANTSQSSIKVDKNAQQFSDKEIMRTKKRIGSNDNSFDSQANKNTLSKSANSRVLFAMLDAFVKEVFVHVEEIVDFENKLRKLKKPVAPTITTEKLSIVIEKKVETMVKRRHMLEESVGNFFKNILMTIKKIRDYHIIVRKNYKGAIKLFDINFLTSLKDFSITMQQLKKDYKEFLEKMTLNHELELDGSSDENEAFIAIKKKYKKMTKSIFNQIFDFFEIENFKIFSVLYGHLEKIQICRSEHVSRIEQIEIFLKTDSKSSHNKLIHFNNILNELISYSDFCSSLRESQDFIEEVKVRHLYTTTQGMDILEKIMEEITEYENVFHVFKTILKQRLDLINLKKKPDAKNQEDAIASLNKILSDFPKLESSITSFKNTIN